MPVTMPELLFLLEFPPEEDKLKHEPDFIATLGEQRRELVRSLLPFIAILGDKPSAVTPDGGSNWLAAEELEPLK